MNAPPPPIDVVSVAIALAGLIFGHDLAQIVGPYAVIIMGASLGGALSAARLEPGKGMSVSLHMVLYVMAAVLITVPTAYLLERQFGFGSKWLLGPVAILVAGIGQDWPALVRWAIAQARRFVEHWVGTKTKDEGGQP